MVIAINERDHRLGNLDLAGNLAIGKNVFKNCCTQNIKIISQFYITCYAMYSILYL